MRGSRSGQVILAIAAVALLSAIALVQQTWITWTRQAEGARRMRQGVADVAARNFVGRLQVTLGNDVALLLEEATRSAPSPLTAAAVSTALDRCHCRLGRHVTVVIVDGPGGTSLTRGTAPSGRLAGIPRAVRQMAVAGATPPLWLDGTEIGIFTALPATAGTPPLGVALRLPVTALQATYAPFVTDSTGRLFPGALASAPASYPSIAIVLEAHGVPVFSTGAAPAYGPSLTLPVTVDSGLIARVVAHPLLEVPLPSVPRWQPPLVGLLTLATLLAVVATVLLANRSAQLGQMQGAFAAAVSHELRTPLTQIILQAELLERGRISPEALGDTARLIRAEARRLHQMVENALFVSRSGHASFMLRLRPVSLAPLVTSIVDGFRPIAGQRNTQVVCASTALPVAIADPDAVRQVLLNLLDNALRHGPEGQTIQVTLEEDATGVVVQVSDEGPGIPLAQRGEVFAPWSRRDTTTQQAGAGLGLSVVDALVRQMGGQVAILDAPGGGARVQVTLSPAPATSA